MKLIMKIFVIILILLISITGIYFINYSAELEKAAIKLDNNILKLKDDIDNTNKFLNEKIWKKALHEANATNEQLLLDNTENKAKFKFDKNSNSNKFSRCQVSAYQGVEVHFNSLEWRNKKFSHSVGDDLVKPFYGRNEFSCNKLDFDPDLPSKGYPNIVGEITDPTVFDLNNFLRTPLGAYQLSKYLNSTLTAAKPIDTQTWVTRVNNKYTKVRMENWLLEFDLSINVVPAQSNDIPQTIKKNLVNKITGEAVKDMRDENDNYRYGALDIILEFIPKTTNWYIENDADNTSNFDKGKLKIGIAAVEVIYTTMNKNKLHKVDSNGSSYLSKGSTLALFNAIDSFPTRSSINGLRNKNKIMNSKPDSLKTDTGTLNPNIFGTTKYAIVTFPNFGTWHENPLLGKEKLHADSLYAKLLIHTFVVGEWSLKRKKIVKFEPPQPIKFEGKSIFENIGNSVSSFFHRFLPDFGLSFFTYLFWPIIIIVLLILFFPGFFGLLTSGLIKSIKSILNAISKSKEK